MIRLAHLSDVHITTAALDWRWQDWFSKRLSSWFNLRGMGRGRRFRHAEEVLAILMRDVQQRGIDHVLFSGDATALGFEAEMRRAAELLEVRQRPGLAVPGNHDYLTKGAARSGLFERIFAPWQTGQRPCSDNRLALRVGVNNPSLALRVGDKSPSLALQVGDDRPSLALQVGDNGVSNGADAPLPTVEDTYPFAQKLGPAWVIGVNSAVGNFLAFDASGKVGQPQRERLRRLLAELPDGPRLLVTHYPVCLSDGHRGENRFRGLRDLAEVVGIAAAGGVSVWLHGHRHHAFVLPSCALAPFAAVCVGSATQTNRWTYNEYTVDEHCLQASRRTFDPKEKCFHETQTFQLPFLKR